MRTHNTTSWYFPRETTLRDAFIIVVLSTVADTEYNETNEIVIDTYAPISTFH